jgi:SAM-dependent methyltransferase
VVSFNSFEYIPDPAKALREALRVTRPGGYLYITFDPIWTANTGSHFAGFVPEPWAHLVLHADSFAGRMASAGAQEWQVDEFRGAMNKVRLAEFEHIFAGAESDGLGTVAFRNGWSGIVDPGSTAHENFCAARALGYSEQELLARGLQFVLRRSDHGMGAATGGEQVGALT